MRLLHVAEFVLYEFFEPTIPPYAILSHRWEEDEILFKDVQSKNGIFAMSHLRSYRKLLFACKQALNDGLTYIWIDTCCIDKSSSSELTEAINSMFRWYCNSQVCYAFLADITYAVSWTVVLNSIWFTRGWTLQELIAPRRLIFYDWHWNMLGERSSISDLLSDRLRIPGAVLNTNNIQAALRGCSAAQKMSWASERQTTRMEDQAYCLLGIFDVTLPFLYGEGAGAFVRLQEKILKSGNDLSILAWNHDAEGKHFDRRLFADSPAQFHDCGDIVAALPFPDMAVQDTTFTINKGLQITHPPIIAHPKRDIKSRYALSLGCRRLDDPHGVLALKIQTVEAIQMLNQQIVSNRRTYFAGWDTDKSTDSRLIRERFNAPSFSKLLPDLTISKERVIDKMNYRQAFIAPHEYLWFLLPVLRPHFAWRAINFFPRGDWDREALACSVTEEKRSNVLRRSSRSFRAFALQSGVGESLAVYLKFKKGSIQFSLAAYDAFTFPVFEKDSFRMNRDLFNVSETCSVEIVPYNTRQSGKLVRQLQIRVHRKGLKLSTDVVEIAESSGRRVLPRRATTLPAVLQPQYMTRYQEIDGRPTAAMTRPGARQAGYELDSGWLPQEAMALSRSLSDTAAVVSKQTMLRPSVRQCLTAAHNLVDFDDQPCLCYRSGLARLPLHSSIQMSDSPAPDSYYVVQSPRGPYELDSTPLDRKNTWLHPSIEDDWRSPACIAIWYRTILPSVDRAWQEYGQAGEDDGNGYDLEPGGADNHFKAFEKLR